MSTEEKKEEQIHLCDSCMNEYPSCISNPVFGHDFGNDNVVICDAYHKIEEKLCCSCANLEACPLSGCEYHPIGKPTGEIY